MTDLSFECVGVTPQRFTAAPTLVFHLLIKETSGARVGAIALRSQIRIQPLKRSYTETEARRLVDIFGERDRWPTSMKPVQLATVAAMVPGFVGSVEYPLDVACSYDLEVAVGRYFNALEGGDVPLVLLFSGTVFGVGDDGMVVEQLPWYTECEYRLPVRLWRELMDLYFPDSGWLRLDREILLALGDFKSRYALPTWDRALQALLEKAGELQR